MAKRTQRVPAVPRPTFDAAAIDAIIGDTKTPAELESLFRAMKQVIVERILNAELTHHLGYGPGAARARAGNAGGRDPYPRTGSIDRSRTRQFY